MKCLCWGCGNEASFGQGQCEDCLRLCKERPRGCGHAVPTEKRRVDLLVANPLYQSSIERLMKHVKPDDKVLFSGEMAKLLALAIDHGIQMAQRK
jgi:predicted amidophosphoribosyltransferase